MISISHWGMFSDFRPFMIPKWFKLSEADLAEWNKPGRIIEMFPLAKGEPQPVYIAPQGDGAPDIELTPQSVQAGVAAYRQFDRDYDSDEEMVQAVYLAIRQHQPSDLKL